MNRNIINLTLLLLYAVLLGACQNAATTTTDEHAGEHGAADDVIGERHGTEFLE